MLHKSGECVSGFAFDRDQLNADQLAQIRQIAACIVATQRECLKIGRVRLIGHTDPVGPAAYNVNLGLRRARNVSQALQRALEALQPGLARAMTFTVESRGESEPVDLDNRPPNRRVEIFPQNFVPVRTGCGFNLQRLRLHLKVLAEPCVPIAHMVDNLKRLYGLCGFQVDIASTERLRPTPDLGPDDVIDVGECNGAVIPPEQQALFNNRNNVREGDIVVYFVRATNPPLNGCAAHPPGRPGLIVTRIASEWTLAHELGHVLGLNHPDDTGNRRLIERLMTGGGTRNIIKAPPDLVPCEVRTMDASALTRNC